MIKYNIINPTASRPTVGDSESLSNFGVIIPKDVFRAARNTTVLDMHLRQAIQDRPYHYFNGSAEHLLLDPLARIVCSGGDPIQFMLQLAKDTNAVSKGLSMMGSKIAITSVSQTFSSLLPNTKIPNQFDRPLEANAKGDEVLKSGLSVFSTFFDSLMTSKTARDTIFKTFRSPNPAIKPGNTVTGNPTNDTIASMFDMFEVFGMAGKRQPLFGSDITPVLAKRFSIEHYLFSDPSGKLQAYEEDSRIASAIWYLMYDQIVKTPESYDAALPVVPPSPQDSQVAAQVLKLLGTFTHTSISAAMSPLYMEAVVQCKLLSELLEFLSTGPVYDEDALAKCRKMLGECNEMITEHAYSPVISLANATFDYVKKLTAARYLLPEFTQTYYSVNGEKPFDRMKLPTSILPPAGFRGSIPDCQRIVEFGGLDLPMVFADVRRKTEEVLAQLIAMSQLRTTLHSGMASQYGNVITHLDTLGNLTRDPALGQLEYPTPTKVYITPSYIPKYALLANSTPDWIFSSRNLMYAPFFPIAFQYDQIQKNMGQQAFAWDTEVNLPPSPATGSDFACLMLPYPYVADCTSRSIANNISSVGQQLAASPHHPMKQVTDYFTPLFHALSSGLNKHEVIANSVASMFSIYKKKLKSKSAARFDDASAWDVITPQVPFIYGYPTKSLLTANAPWASNTAYPCTKEHVYISRDGMFMAVLHRALPKPTSLAYVPFTLEGGIKVSLPVNQNSYNKALSEISRSAISQPESFYSSMFERLSVATMENNLLEVKSWSPSFAYYPHLFVANRHVTSASGVILSAVPRMLQRLTLVSDDAAPYGGVMSYFHTPVIGFDPLDELEAITSAEIAIDINGEIKKKENKGIVSASDTTIPVTKLNTDLDVVQKVNEAPITPDEKTKPSGELETTQAPPIGPYNPEITDKDVETNPNAD